MAFKTGDPKPPGSGRKKGQTNRKSMKALKQGLADKDFDLASELLKLLKSDDDQIKLSTLRLICQFTHAIPKVSDEPDEGSEGGQPEPEKPKAETMTSDNLIQFVKKGAHDDDEE